MECALHDIQWIVFITLIFEATPGTFLMQKYSRLESQIRAAEQRSIPPSHPPQLRACGFILLSSFVLLHMRMLCGVYFNHIMLGNEVKTFQKVSQQSRDLIMSENSVCAAPMNALKWSGHPLCAEMKAGQKAGVSHERYAKRSVVCQDRECWVTGSVLVSYTILHSGHTAALHDLFTEPCSPSVSTVLLLQLYLLCHILSAF